MGKGLPASAEVLASSPSEHLNEPQPAWRRLSLEQGIRLNFPLAAGTAPTLGENHVTSGGRGAWASTNLAAGKWNEFVSARGFCTFILMILQVLIL